MKISLNWLREFIQIDIEPEKIAELLTLKGIEVSDVYPVGRDLQKIICAKIIRIRKHPNADNLYICDTDTGERIIPVICSAPNIKEVKVETSLHILTHIFQINIVLIMIFRQ